MLLLYKCGVYLSNLLVLDACYLQLGYYWEKLYKTFYDVNTVQPVHHIKWCTIKSDYLEYLLLCIFSEKLKSPLMINKRPSYKVSPC